MSNVLLKNSELQKQISLFDTIEQTNEFIENYPFSKENKLLFDFWRSIIKMNKEMLMLQSQSLEYHTDSSSYYPIKTILMDIVCKEKYPEILKQKP